MISKNEYISADGTWIRNFTKFGVNPITITNMIRSEEYELLLRNEEINRTLQIPGIANEKFRFPNIVIVSDGFNFEARHQELLDLPSNVMVIAVNGALNKWKLTDPTRRKAINFYVVNNPYSECTWFLPKKSKYYPTCVASSRTNPEFLKAYTGRKFLYEPTPTRFFGIERHQSYYIDDYRNPICAAIGLAYQLGVQKLMLMCCDDSFSEERPGSVKLGNGLWTYPQHLKSKEIIEGNLFWLRRKENKVKICDYSDISYYKHAVYIDGAEKARAFFEEEERNAI
jgi:hypothetical protein